MMRFRVSVLLTVALGLLVAAAGCKGKPVAKVDGEVISQEQFFDALQSGRVNASAAANALDLLVTRTLVLREAKKRNITISDEEMAQAVSQHQLMFQSEWEPLLGAGLATEQDVIDEIQFVIYLAKLFIKDDEIRKFFEENKSRFDRPREVKFRRLAVKTKKEADEIREQILAKKATFEEMVREHSIAPGADVDEGVVGPLTEGFTQGRNATLEALLFDELKLEEISEPIEVTVWDQPSGERATQWHLMEVLERKPAIPATYQNSWYAAVYFASLDPGYRERIHSGTNKLKADATIEVYMPKYRSLARQYEVLKHQQPPRFGPPAGKAEPGETAPPAKAPSKAGPPGGE